MDGDALLRVILADPADDTARLVYADWCDENGQPERAEFIRAQIRIYRAYGDGMFVKGLITERELELLAWHLTGRPEVGVPPSLCGSPAVSLGWDRGFVELVNCPAKAWIDGAETLLANHPVRVVYLTTRPDPAWVFANAPGDWLDSTAVAVAGPSAREVLSHRWPHIVFVVTPSRSDI